MVHKQPLLLVILDGFGYSENKKYNAIAQAKTPNIDAWWDMYPHALLEASGASVGLLPGTIGTSEVGHLTMGAGRIIPESVLRLHQAIDDGSFFKNPTLTTTLARLKATGGRLHLMGLLSDGGVHSHEKHVFALIQAAGSSGIPQVYIHAFLDGRDVPPRSAEIYLQRLETVFKKYGCGTLASLHGRFYAMDRDKNWQRTQESYNVLTTPQPASALSWQQVLQQAYAGNVNDEFLPPVQLIPEGIIRPGDSVIFFNFRADRARQLTRCFVEPTSVPFAPLLIRLHSFLTATNYDHELRPDPSITTGVLLVKEPVTNTLKELLAQRGKTMLSIAETEKYAHVTYFFGGGREKEFSGEEWVLIPSIKTRDYVHHPEMSAATITDTVLKSLTTAPKDFYLINYANADMVGHSGNFEATVKAVEFLDRELGRLYAIAVEQMHGTIIVTGDHGNAEDMFDEQAGQMRTAHTLNPVPCMVIKKGLSQKTLPLTQLKDLAPFILKTLPSTLDF